MDRIRELRKAQRLTQEQLADKAGLSRSHLSEIESGKVPVNTLRLRSLAAALSVSTTDLFNQPTPADRDELAEIYSRLSAEHQAMVLHHAHALAALDARNRPGDDRPDQQTGE